MPIVEPEVLMDGDHDIDRCYERHRVDAARPCSTSSTTPRVKLEGMVLKPNMVVPGKKCAQEASRRGGRGEDRARAQGTVPAAVPGIAFLSGGQSDEEATAHLDAMNASSAAAVEAHLLLRPRAAGSGAEGLGRQGGERRGRPARLRAPRAHERPRRDRQMEAGPGEEGGLTGSFRYATRPRRTRCSNW